MFKLSITDNVSKDLDEFGEDSEMNIMDTLEVVTKRVAADAEAGAPKDTGKGAASITTDVGYTRYKKPYGAIRCGAGDAYYMVFSEYGTSKMPARPFMRPAADKNRDYITESIRAAIKRTKWQ
jgi:HK97 gp10 family phage protein